MPHDLHRRLRPELGLRHRARPSTSASRPRRCRTCSTPSTTRWCSRPATWSAACRALAWHLEEPRVGQSYPNYYAAQLASKFVKVVLSGAGGDELFGGYPWRYYRAVVNDDFDDYVDKYYGFWQRLMPTPTHRARASRRSGATSRDVGRATSSATCSTTPRAAADAARGLHQPLALLRGEDVPARPARRRGQAHHGARPRDAACRSSTTTSSTSPCACPVRLKLGNLGEVVRLNENEPGPKTERYFERHARRQAAAAQGDGALRAREITDAREAGLLRAGRELVPRREHRLRAPRACSTRDARDLRVPRPRRGARPGRASTSTARRTAGC